MLGKQSYFPCEAGKVDFRYVESELKFQVDFRDTESELRSNDRPSFTRSINIKTQLCKFPGQGPQFQFKTFCANVAICFKILKIVQTSVLVIPFLGI